MPAITADSSTSPTAILKRSAAMEMRRKRTGRAMPGRAASSQQSGSRSMSQMNVTPFIDVLLVLLIMLIMAVPVLTHETQIDLPGPPPIDAVQSDTNTVFITANDQLMWNGAPVTREELSARVAYAATLPSQPLLRFEPDAQASYDTSAKTIALIKDAGAEKFAFAGNHRHKDFGR